MTEGTEASVESPAAGQPSGEPAGNDGQVDGAESAALSEAGTDNPSGDLVATDTDLSFVSEAWREEARGWSPEFLADYKAKAEGSMKDADYRQKTEAVARERAELQKEAQATALGKMIEGNPQLLAMVTAANAGLPIPGVAPEPPQNGEGESLFELPEPDFMKRITEQLRGVVQEELSSHPTIRQNQIESDLSAHYSTVYQPQGVSQPVFKKAYQGLKAQMGDLSKFTPQQLETFIAPHVQWQQGLSTAAASKPPTPPATRAASVSPTGASGVLRKQLPWEDASGKQTRPPTLDEYKAHFGDSEAQHREAAKDFLSDD